MYARKVQRMKEGVIIGWYLPVYFSVPDEAGRYTITTPWFPEMKTQSQTIEEGLDRAKEALSSLGFSLTGTNLYAYMETSIEKEIF